MTALTAEDVSPSKPAGVVVPPSVEGFFDDPINQHDFKHLLLEIVQNVSSLRSELKSLATEISSVKQQLNSTNQHPSNPGSPKFLKSAIIMKSPTFSHFTLEKSPPLCDEACCQKHVASTSHGKPNSAHLFFAPGSHQHSRCVKFDLPAKTHRHHWRDQPRQPSATSNTSVATTVDESEGGGEEEEEEVEFRSSVNEADSQQ